MCASSTNACAAVCCGLAVVADSGRDATEPCALDAGLSRDPEVAADVDVADAQAQLAAIKQAMDETMSDLRLVMAEIPAMSGLESSKDLG